MGRKMRKSELPKGSRQRVPKEGWGARDWAEQAIESCSPLGCSKWNPSEIFFDEYSMNANAFVAGAAWTAMWFAQECSGGRFREVTIAVCGKSVDAMMLQRFLEHMERIQEIARLQGCTEDGEKDNQ